MKSKKIDPPPTLMISQCVTVLISIHSLYHNLFHIEHPSYPVLSAAPWFGGAGFGSSYFGSWNPRGCHFL